ncbi:polyketide cyclase/dehydrase/lipid transport protein [Kribbella rubisoli]|uniref:Polyketide cyclase/dehydrase/lipid transport protein n=1 Tax=Kribbella rubisoli TaxID=3075929 RepID=A0A4V2FYT0_9ACTN|nr:SRPBCC family protein [Kribbella rubisoli]RZU18766.1 polyketide cyclase/dehydrase/lipid transport protein [Kribbella rubisoli]
MTGTGSCHAEASVVLRLSPEAAWDVVMDWDRQSRWMLLTRVWGTENDGIGVGGGVAARTSVGGVGFTDDMVITHWDPPRECTVKHLGTIVRGTGTFTIAPVSTGSVFTWEEDVDPPLGRLGWIVARPAFELMMRVSLRRLVREVQA